MRTLEFLRWVAHRLHARRRGDGALEAGEPMTLYPSDLQYMTPDADGLVRLNRGTSPQIPPPFPFPSFPGDTRFYSGLASDVGVGLLLGWELVAGITAGTLVRLATTDAEVGTISGTNSIQPVITAGQTLAPTGSVDVAHDHGGQTSLAGAGGNGGTPTATTTFDEGAGASFTVASSGHRHLGNDHRHDISDGPGSPNTLDIDPVSLNAVTLDPITISPQAYAVWLIKFTGVAAAGS